MSFFYTNSVASARSSRRGREKDTHHRTSSISTSNRRPKDTTKPQENRSPPPKASTPLPVLPRQTLLAPGQLPASQPSSTVTPTGSSPSLKATQLSLNTRGVYHLPSYQLHTPASLQPYLEDDAAGNLVDSTQLPSDDQTRMRKHILDPPPTPAPHARQLLSDHTGLVHEIQESCQPHKEAKNRSKLPAKGDEMRETDHESISYVPEARTAYAPSDFFVHSVPPRPPPGPASETCSSQVSRAFTPPAPPLGMVQPQNLSLFTSPLLMDASSMDADTYGYAGLSNYSSARHSIASHNMHYGSIPYTPYHTGYPAASYPSMPLLWTDPDIPPSFDERINLENSPRLDLCYKNEDALLLKRVQTMLPDLHLLIDRYTELCGPTIGGTTNHQGTETEALGKKDIYIKSLLEELQSRTRIYSAERAELRLGINNLEVMYRRLQNEVFVHRNSRYALELAVKRLQEENATVDKRVQEGIALATRNFSVWKADVIAEFEAKEKHLRNELDSKADEALSRRSQVSEMGEAQPEERDTHEVCSVSERTATRDVDARIERGSQASIKAQKASSQQVLEIDLQSGDQWKC